MSNRESMSKTLLALFLLFGVCGTNVLAQNAKRATLEGVWKVTEVVVTGAGAYTTTSPQPSVFIFAKNHYSFLWVMGNQPRALYKTQPPTDEEKLAAFDSLNAGAGTYEVNGSTVTFRHIVAKGPNAAFISEQFKIEGDTLTLTWISSDSHIRMGKDIVRVPSTLPVSSTRMKLVRVE
jgi:hypothetical protein